MRYTAKAIYIAFLGLTFETASILLFLSKDYFLLAVMNTATIFSLPSTPET